MISTAKAEALSRNLSERLNFRFKASGLSCVASKDTNGFPCLLLADATPATGEKAIFMRFIQADMVSKDIFGNSTYAYTPHIFQFCTETGSALAREDIAVFMLEIGKIGILTEVYERANGAVPAVGDLVSGNLKGSFEYDVLAPTKGM
jgi:hypothetical protein